MACDSTLLALFEAYEADPDSSTEEPLVEYIESLAGHSIRTLLQPEWDLVEADGVGRSKTIVLDGCELRFDIDGAPGLSSCQDMPTMSYPISQHDFDMPTQVTGSYPELSPELGTPYTKHMWSQVPDATLHIEDPEMVWLHTTNDAGIISRVPGLVGRGLTVGGVLYRSYIQTRLHYTMTIGHRISELWNYNSISETWSLQSTTEQYWIPRILVGLHREVRDPSGGIAPTIDDPVALGTISSGNVINSDYVTDNSPNSPGTNKNWPQIASTDASPTSFTGTWSTLSALEDAIDLYNADRTAYDPVVTLDLDNESITVSHMTRENAVYLTSDGCEAGEGASSADWEGVTINCGGFYLVRGWQHPRPNSTGDEDFMDGIQQRIVRREAGTPPDVGDTSVHYVASEFDRILPGQGYVALLGTIEVEDMDGTPPEVIPNPPLVTPIAPPVSGACKATIDGPSSCNFNVPIDPEFSDPELPEFPMPGDFVEPDFPVPLPMPEMPVMETDFPMMPPIDCLMPDFGNLSDCPPGPGSGNLPGGRDASGARGDGVMGITTGGPTSDIRDITFNEDFPIDDITEEPPIDPDTGEPIVPPQRSWPAGSSVMAAITVILLDLGISPINIVFEVGPEWDKTFGPKTFDESVRMFDAAQWLASLIMCKIIDEGDGNVYIGPPTHKPGQNTWTFNSQFPNADGEPPMFGLGYGASMGEAYYAVKVWGAHLSEPVFALVDTPFANDPQNILQIEVGPNYTLAEAQDLAAFRAGLIRRDAVMVQVEVPYSQNYFMRDKMILKFPDRGLQWEYIIFGKTSEVSIEKQVHILTGVLPATLEELENFPEVMEEGMNAIDMGFA